MLKNVKLGTKLIGGASLVALIMIINSALAYWGIIKINKNIREIAGVRLPSITSLSIINEAQTAVQRAERSMLIPEVSKNEKERDNHSKQAEDALKRAEMAWKIYEPLPQTKEEEKLWKQYVPLWEQWKGLHNQVVTLVKSGKRDEAMVLSTGRAREAFNESEKLLGEILSLNNKVAMEEDKNASDSAASAKTILIIVGVTGVLLGLGTNLFIRRITLKQLGEDPAYVAEIAAKVSVGDVSMEIDTKGKDEKSLIVAMRNMVETIRHLVADVGTLSKAAVEGKLATRADATKHQGDFQKIVQGVNDTLDAVIGPINEAAEVLAATAEKDMTKRVKGDYKGQLAELKENINQAIENLDQTLGQVTEAVDQVMSGGNQISSGSQSLAEGANEQASSLEEISSSLEEMSSMTKQNAENANQAKGLAETARLSAVKGNEAMKRMEAAIQQIKASSDQTAKIVKTIDEIAFQTNLLALNAAVEAARAGEAGMGFAVVAEEVRNLAQRSAEAAKNTANMIEESVKNAEGGVKITEEVAKTLAEIVEGSGKVNMLVAEIAAASSEQAKGIEQVNVGVVQMNKVTQLNAANSEESAAAAEELSGQATELGSLVRSFVLSTNGGTGMVRQAAGRSVMEPKAAQAHGVRHGEPASKGQAQALAKVVKGKKGGNGPVAHVLKPEKIIPFKDDADDALSKF